MLTILFLLLMIVVFGKLIWLAMRAAWGITKVLFSIVFFANCIDSFSIIWFNGSSTASINNCRSGSIAHT